MQFSGQFNSQVIQSANKNQGQQQQQQQYPVVVQKIVPVQLQYQSQIYNHPQQIYTTTVPKINIIQADIHNTPQIQSFQQVSQQQVSQLVQKQKISQIQAQTQMQTQVHTPANLQTIYVEDKQKVSTFKEESKKQKDEFEQTNRLLEELVGKKDFEIQQLKSKLSQQDERNMETLQNLGKTMQMEKMKILDKNNQEQNDFMEQVRRKQVEEYEEILEENRKLQLEINRLTREKEGISGRLEIARQELKENADRRRQIVDLEQKLKDRELDIFKLKQYGSQLEMKIEELIAENRKLTEGAELQLYQNDELMKKTQYAEQSVRTAMESKFMVERQVEEFHKKGNQQQEYLNKVLEKLANVQRENEEMYQKVNMWEQEGTRMTEEMRNQQRYSMDLVGKLKTVENEKLILEDKIEKLEKFLRQVKEKAEREEKMRHEIFEDQEARARENGELVARLEGMNEQIEAKNKEIKTMSRKVKKIEQQVGSQTNEVASIIKSKEDEIYKVLKMNKSYKEKIKEKEKEIERLTEQYVETKEGLGRQEHELKEVLIKTTTLGQEHNEVKQKYEEKAGDNEKLKEKCKELEQKLRKMYEDNQVLFSENKELKQIIAQFKSNDAAHYQCLEENKALRKQLDEERIRAQKKFEEIDAHFKIQLEQNWHKVIQQCNAERAQIVRIQENARVNEQKYGAQIRQLESTLNKIQNDNLHIQFHGQNSFETLFKEFNQIQQHNQCLMEQLRQYECKFENLFAMQERFMGDQCHFEMPNPVMPIQTMPLIPIQTNIITPPPQLMSKPYVPNYTTQSQRPYIENNTPNYKTSSNKDDRLNQKIFKRCREIVTQYD